MENISQRYGPEREREREGEEGESGKRESGNGKGMDRRERETRIEDIMQIVSQVSVRYKDIHLLISKCSLSLSLSISLKFLDELHFSLK